MGKKKQERKKKKKNRSKKSYNKKQFVEILCQQCNVCESVNPSFCYDVYKRDPITFVNDCYMGLLKLRMQLDNVGGNLNIIDMSKFRETFCHVGICGPNNFVNKCAHEKLCFDSFINQISGKHVKSKSLKHINKKSKQKKERMVFVAYPTFFSSDNEEFKAKIGAILNDGN